MIIKSKGIYKFADGKFTHIDTLKPAIFTQKCKQIFQLDALMKMKLWFCRQPIRIIFRISEVLGSHY